ncbi:hypothetical protein NLG97_g9323 [Lecanicillium saksenae]|uniref:Uncharacterized protein n=1 Tax=Lecanicillium saksenae TaxID=468837 RepID=A0ACC1QI15_9HYPO|nr:hypothetical protein NLG97_g9323 [Lecanicillium saksenae]
MGAGGPDEEAGDDEGPVGAARLQALEMAVACFQIEMQREGGGAAASLKGKRGGDGGGGDKMQSFRVIAAACMLNELEAVTGEVQGDGMALTRQR